MSPSGEYTIVWQSDGQDGDGAGVYARPFDNDGSPLGGERLINSTTTGVQEMPSVAQRSAADFVYFDDNGTDGVLLDDALARVASPDGRLQFSLHRGRFDDPDFDIVNDPTAHAGLTCTSCHAINRVNSVLGNADFSIDEPVSYPFERSDSPWLRAVSRQLIKAKPAYHKQGFLKPLHATPEFCGGCHKAHLPISVNGYKWLRAQNHYDSFMRSGVPGHRVDSFYYPARATETCADCHMPLEASDDPAARDFDGSGARKIHSHLFPAANTGVKLGIAVGGIAADEGPVKPVFHGTFLPHGAVAFLAVVGVDVDAVVPLFVDKEVVR